MSLPEIENSGPKEWRPGLSVSLSRLSSTESPLIPPVSDTAHVCRFHAIIRSSVLYSETTPQLRELICCHMMSFDAHLARGTGSRFMREIHKAVLIHTSRYRSACTFPNGQDTRARMLEYFSQTLEDVRPTGSNYTSNSN